MSKDNIVYNIVHYFYKQFGKLDPIKYIFILVFILFSSWLADGCFGTIFLIFSNLNFFNLSFLKDYFVVLQLLLSILFFLFLYKIIKKEIDKITNRIRYSVKKVVPEDIKALVIFLSKPTFNLKELDNINSIQDFQKEEIKKQKINWEVPIIIIDKIINNLKKDLKIVYVILSKESNEYFQDFKNLVKKLINKDIEVLSLEDVVDFEDLESTIDAIDKSYSYLDSINIKNNQIIIDITGGQKIQSTAGGFYASSYDRYFCYLSTNTKELYIFDVIYNFE